MSTTFTTTANGTSMEDAFNEAVSLAQQEPNDHNDHDWDEEDYDENKDDDFDDDDGYDGYNGTISTTGFVKNATEDYRNSGKTIEKFIDDTLNSDAIGTRECWGIEIKEGKYVFFGWAAY